MLHGMKSEAGLEVKQVIEHAIRLAANASGGVPTTPELNFQSGLEARIILCSILERP